MHIKVMAFLLSIATVIATMASVIFFMKTYILFGICMVVVGLVDLFLSAICFMKKSL